MKTDTFRIAMLSIHSSPVGELGTHDTGGMSVYIRELAIQLGRRGHRVDIFTRALPPGAELVTALHPGVRLVHLEGETNGRHERFGLYPFLPGFFRSLERFRAAEELDYDLVHSHYWLSARMGSWAQEAWQVPHLVMFHTLGAVKNGARCGEEEPAVRIAAEADLARRCDRIVAPTRRERDHLIRHCGARPEKVVVIPCGVSLERFRPLGRDAARSRVKVAPDETVILYVGRFAQVKGLDRLLEAVPHLEYPRRPRLLVVGGDGPGTPAVEELRAKAREVGIEEGVTFTGRVDQQDLPPYYSAADVLVVPSYCESFGLVALESLACGTPVVATRVGAMDQILGDELGETVAADATPAGLARGVERVLARSRSGGYDRRRIRERVSRYTWAAVASAIADEYESLVLPSRSAGREGAGGGLASR